MYNRATLQLRFLLFFYGMLCASTLFAGAPVFEIEIRNHLFIPSEFTIPANTKIKLIVYNRDPTPEEFESYELNREKVIVGNRKATIFIGPLPADWKPRC
jgi:hypothetical protein